MLHRTLGHRSISSAVGGGSASLAAAAAAGQTTTIAAATAATSLFAPAGSPCARRSIATSPLEPPQMIDPATCCSSLHPSHLAASASASSRNPWTATGRTLTGTAQLPPSRPSSSSSQAARRPPQSGRMATPFAGLVGLERHAYHTTSSIQRRSMVNLSAVSAMTKARTAAPLPLDQRRSFHASSSRRGPEVLITLVAGFAKSSYAVACVVAVSRFVFTLVPLTIIGRIKRRKSGHKQFMLNLAPVIDDSIRKFYYDHCKDECVEHVCYRRVWTFSKQRRIEVAQPIYQEAVATSRERVGLPRELSEGQVLPSEGSDLQPWRRMWFLSHIVRVPTFPEGSAAAEALGKLSDDEKWQLVQMRMWKGLMKHWYRHWRVMNAVMWGILFVPIVGFALVAAFSLERVPYTGRWRLVMLSPTEEDAISSKLRGPGWFQQVLSILTTAEAPAPAVVPIEDWRWHWVNSVLRRLEAGVIEQCDVMHREGRQQLPSLTATEDPATGELFGGGRTISPEPPLPSHPLHPRPRASAIVHGAAPGTEPGTGREHLEVGPPFSLLLMQSDERNAMTFGFGSEGAGGVVVFSGILDEILSTSESTMEVMAEPEPASPPAGISGLLRNLFAPAPPPAPIPSARPVVQPTREQELKLASVLAHELAHLLLSHHLESLSSTTVLVPVAAGLVGDLLRTVLFPITMLGGPFLNDAISKVFDVGVDESKALSDVAFSRVQEREADLVGLRILAYAGYDPEGSIRTWLNVPKPSCCKDKEDEASEEKGYVHTLSRPLSYFRGGAHDSDEVRLAALQKELDRWRAAST